MNSRISIDSNICYEKPVLKNTRVLVSNILSDLAARKAFEQIIENCPNIDREDIKAALSFGSKLAMFDTVAYEGRV